MKKRSVSRAQANTNSKRKKKSKKLTIQLVPENSELRGKLKDLGANPFVQVSVKKSKTLGFIMEYILTRRYGKWISQSDQQIAPISFYAVSEEKEWSRENEGMLIDDMFNALKKPQPFRLKYWFEPGILHKTDEGIVGALSSSTLFDAKTKTTKTIFDGNSNSLFNIPENHLDPFLFGDLSLGVGNGNSSFLGTPIKSAGPLASQFDASNSFVFGADLSFGNFNFDSASQQSRKALFK